MATKPIQKKSAFVVQTRRNLPPPVRPVEDNVHLYVTYQEVFGRPTTINHLTTLLSKLNINDVIRTVAVVNNLYAASPSHTPAQMRQLQLSLIRQVCSDELVKKLAASPFGSDVGTAFFHHQQQLFLLRHALTACPHEGGLPWDAQAHHIFGEACLVANDLIGPRQPLEAADDGHIALAHMLVPLQEFGADHEPISLIGRAVQLWLKIPEENELKKEANYIDFARVFQEKYGVELENFLRVMFTLFAETFRDDINPDQPWEHFVINLEKTFVNTRYDKDVLRKVMTVLSYRLAEMGNLLYEQPTHSPKHDFTGLQRFPGIEVEDGIYVIYDREILLRFFTVGIWWRIHDALPEDKQKDFRSFFGKVYATYVERVLSHVCNAPESHAKHQLILRPRFDASAEVCDALIITDDSWIMIETKASLFTTRAKYSEDDTTFKRELDDRFFGNPNDKKNKGVCQLAHSISKLANGAKIMNTDLDFSKAKRVYMVIISYDLAASGKFTAAYLDKKMRGVFGVLPPGAPAVLPLTILGSADIEAFTSLGRRHLMPQLLASYRHRSQPLKGFKDHIFAVHHNDIRIDESFSMRNYFRIHQAVINDFHDSVSNVSAI